jgi:ferredoxin
MKIYYFTGTGNSLVVAKDISNEIQGDIVSIPSVMGMDKIIFEDKELVIVFPVYMWGIPLIVKRFIEKIEDIKEKKIYGVATYGGKAGGTINSLGKFIKRNNGLLSGGFTVCMPGNYTPMYGAISESKQKKMFDDWSKKAKKIASYIKDGNTGIYENGNLFMNFIFSNIVYNLLASKIPKMDKQFWVDDNCNKCGICQKVCPTGNISIQDGKPIWHNKCEQCLACLQWCQKTAIQCGKRTTGKKRYHHPDIKVSDIISTYQQ